MADGNGVDLQAPLSRMWRDVYQKAAAVAHARAQELLKYHVYVYPHGAGGGGGGGAGFVLVAEAVVAAGSETQAVRLPASGPLPAGRDLLLLGTARTRRKVASGGIPTATNVWVSFNDDPIDGAGIPSPTYGWEWHEHDGYAPRHEPNYTQNDLGIQLGYCPGEGGPAGHFSHHRAEFPDFASTVKRNGCTFQAVLQYDGDAELRTAYEGGGNKNGTGAITSLTVFTNGPYEFVAGTVWRLYASVPGAGGGGGGGATDVTITTDASLTVTEAPAETFALAVRLSADAGNALALRGNGLYATDTGGGGGTGNTTMYTQTSAPSGATNSLWFNPSESA